MQLNVNRYEAAPPEVEKLYRNFPALDSRQVEPAAIGEDLRPLVNEVNKKVNGSIRYNPQSPSDWAGPKEKTRSSGLVPGKRITSLEGNCRDFVITKMLELQGQGVPVGAMRIADVYFDDPSQESGEQHHLVLLLQQEDGGALVLDNRTPDVQEWRPDLSDYRWNRVSMPGRSEWGAFDSGPSKPKSLEDVIAETLSGVPGDGA